MRKQKYVNHMNGKRKVFGCATRSMPVGSADFSMHKINNYSYLCLCTSVFSVCMIYLFIVGQTRRLDEKVRRTG